MLTLRNAGIGTQRVAILNPVAGSLEEGEVRRALVSNIRDLTIEATSEARSSGTLAREAIAGGADLIIAAGGDGTVSAVADALVGSKIPLAIIPLGTANVLARELGIPLELDQAAELAGSSTSTRTIDAMKVGDRHFFTQVGVGIDALMIRDTTREQKRRLGRLAYLLTACVRLIGLEARKFRIEVDGVVHRHRATQVVVANGGILGDPHFRWGPDIALDDSRVDVCVFSARTLPHFVHLAWCIMRGKHRQAHHVRYYPVAREVVLWTDRPMPVQADGEVIGETPISVEVVAQAVRIIVNVTESVEIRL